MLVSWHTPQRDTRSCQPAFPLEQKLPSSPLTSHGLSLNLSVAGIMLMLTALPAPIPFVTACSPGRMGGELVGGDERWQEMGVWGPVLWWHGSALLFSLWRLTPLSPSPSPSLPLQPPLILSEMVCASSNLHNTLLTPLLQSSITVPSLSLSFVWACLFFIRPCTKD